MNRRTFFALAAGSVPALFLPKLIQPMGWRRRPRWVLNPEWVNAPFERVVLKCHGLDIGRATDHVCTLVVPKCRRTGRLTVGQNPMPERVWELPPVVYRTRLDYALNMVPRLILA